MKPFFSAILIVFIAYQSVQAQFSFNGQILNRSEYRHGYGNLIDTSASAAFSIGQRSRLTAAYATEKARFALSLQDIRTWGNTPQANIIDGYLSLHEAYLEILFNDKLSAKIGRQELDYDDARFLGNLDWVLQARSHDIALLKYADTTQQLQIHAAFAYNQTGDFLSGSYYSLSNQYKIAQMLWINKKWNNWTMGFLLWNNGLQADSSIVHREKVNYTTTLGIPICQYKLKNFALQGFFYYQLGRDIKNKELAAIDASAELNYNKKLNAEKNNKIGLSIGFEYLSGTSQTDTANHKNQSFNPLYGTNHRHNGYMDYFYVGGRHINSVGLIDAYFNLKYDLNAKVFLGGSLHYFSAAQDLKDPQLSAYQDADPYLGTEIDLSAGYRFSESVSFQAGYSQLFAANSLALLRNTSTEANTQNWAYLAILFRPGMKNKFTGLKW